MQLAAILIFVYLERIVVLQLVATVIERQHKGHATLSYFFDVKQLMVTYYSKISN